jgi:hypothetical protein
MRQLRKTGAADQDGKAVTIPRLPSVTGVHKPTGWTDAVLRRRSRICSA